MIEHYTQSAVDRFKAMMNLQEPGNVTAFFQDDVYALICTEGTVLFVSAEMLEKIATQMLKDAKKWKKTGKP